MWRQRLAARLAQSGPLFSGPALSGLELARHVAGLATQLRPDERWVIWESDPAAFSVAVLACWQAGAVPVLPGNGQPQTLAAIAAEGLIATQGGSYQGLVLHPFAHLADPQPPKLGELVLFTSGSTGEPKAVPKSLDQLLTELDALEAAFGPLQGEMLATVSHQHIYGFLFRLLWPLMSPGATINRVAIGYPEQLAGLGAQAEGPLLLVSSPAHLERLPAPEVMAPLLGKLVRVFSSGGLLSAQGAAQALTVLGQSPVEVLGSTETGGVAWRQQQNGSAWRPFAGVACALDEDDGLVVEGVVAGGRVAMGDKALFEADGRFHLNGRRDRIVKIEQKRLSLDAMEKALCRQAGVFEARCLLLDGRRQQLGAVLVLDREGRQRLASLGKHPFNQALRQGLLGEFEPVVLPRRWRVVDAFPLNSQGKVTHQALLSLFDDSHDAAFATGT